MDQFPTLIVIMMLGTHGVDQIRAYKVYTNGNGDGAMCGRRVCAPTATCTDQQECKCSISPHVNGIGGLDCFTNDQYSTSMVNDPFLWTWKQERTEFPLPCQYQLTSFETTLNLNNTQNNRCIFKIRPFNAKNKGKIFTYGYDMATSISGHDLRFASRIYGLAWNGSYVFELQGTANSNSVTGPFNEDELILRHPESNTSLLELYVDYDYNLVVINSSYCGVYIKFRGFDTTQQRNQIMVSGLSVIVDKNASPKFYSTSLNMALDRSETFSGLPMQNIPSVQAMLAYYFSTSLYVTQNTNSLCGSRVSIYYSFYCISSRRRNVIINCSWILTTTKFIRCYDDTFFGTEIMKLFSACLTSHCFPNSCSTFQSTLHLRNCYSHSPMALYFKDNCPVL